MKAAGAEGECLEAVVENDDWVLWAEEMAGVRDVPPAGSPALALPDDAGRARVDEPVVALPAARAFSVAGILSLCDVAGAPPPIDGSAAVAANAGRTAAGWSACSGAGSSSGPGIVWWVGRGDPMGTEPRGRTTLPKNVFPGQRRSAYCTAYCAGVSAIRGAARSGVSTPSRGARAAPNSLGIGVTPEMNVAIAKCASMDGRPSARQIDSSSVFFLSHDWRPQRTRTDLPCGPDISRGQVLSQSFPCSPQVLRPVQDPQRPTELGWSMHEIAGAT